jgi:spore coat polysaccharide biosynthesis protein SpsF
MEGTMRVLSIVQVRIGSTRLHGKALLPIDGKPMFLHVVEAAPDPKIVAIPQNDYILDLTCRDLGIPVATRLDQDDVLARFVRALEVAEEHYVHKFDYVLRMTGDCPMLTEPFVLKFIRACELDNDGQDTIYTNRPKDPDGLDLELFPVWALHEADATTTDPEDREHVCPPLYRMLKTKRLRLSGLPPKVKISVDTREEYLLVKYAMERRIYSLGPAA